MTDPNSNFEALFANVLNAAYGVAYNLTRSHDDAEDLVQEAALLAFRAFHSFEPGTNFKAWYLKILTNQFLQRVRRQEHRPELVNLDDVPELHLFTQTAKAGLHGDGDPVATLFNRLDEEQVAQAMASLPEEFRVVTVMYFMEELQYDEIAALLGRPVGTVRSRLHRGRKLLQKALWQIAVERGIVKEKTNA